MKRNYFILIGTLFLLWVACEKKMADQKRCLRFMEKNSKGITIFQVNSNISFLDLTGKITLTKDEVEMSLLNNENRAFYAIRFHSIDTFSVDEIRCLFKGDRVTFNHKNCNGCGNCAEVCPLGIIQIENNKAISNSKPDFTLCRLCVTNCK